MVMAMATAAMTGDGHGVMRSVYLETHHPMMFSIFCVLGFQELTCLNGIKSLFSTICVISFGSTINNAIVAWYLSLKIKIVMVLRDEDEAMDWAVRQSMVYDAFRTIPVREKDIEGLGR